MKEASSIESLQKQHQQLDTELRRLERRAFLTPNEQTRATDLKKQKLATKDQIFAMRRDDSGP